MARYVVIGAGAVGATVAAQVVRGGGSVVLVARGEHGEVLRRDGLRYVRPEGEYVVPVQVAAGVDEVELDGGDVLVVATKSQDTERVVQDWAYLPVAGGGATAAEALPVVLAQNGLENERVASRRFRHVIGAVVWLPAVHLVPGEVIASGTPAPGAFWLGRHPRGDADERTGAIAADLRTAGFHATVVPDILAWKASKLLSNLANALDALYRPGEARDAAAEAVRAEGRRVLAAHGIEPADIEGDAARVRADVRVADIPGRGRHHSSTWQSLARATSAETDFLNGEIVLLARLAGVPAPLNEALQYRVGRGLAGAAPGSLTHDDLRRDLPGALA